MKFVIILIAILPALYTLSYANYCYKKKNKLAASGAAFIAVTSVIMLTVATFIRW